MLRTTYGRGHSHLACLLACCLFACGLPRCVECWGTERQRQHQQERFRGISIIKGQPKELKLLQSCLLSNSLVTMSLPPLLPKVDAILVLDGDGARLAGKYYGTFLKAEKSTSSQDASAKSKSAEDLRSKFEKELQQKIAGIAARSDAAEVVTVMGKTAVFCGGTNQGSSGGGDVRIVHIGPPNESELVLAHLCEGMYDALSHLMGGSTDRTMVLDNLELVFLLIDEHCDGGIILETDSNKLASAVLLRDDEGPTDQERAGAQAAAQSRGMPAGVNASDMTLGQAFRQARDQFFVGGSGM